MGTLTIRNLEDPLKRLLRLRAAAGNRSMEEEARQILRAVLQEPSVSTEDLASRIRSRFAGLGDVQLALAPREPVRSLPEFEAPTALAAATAKKRPARRR